MIMGTITCAKLELQPNVIVMNIVLPTAVRASDEAVRVATERRGPVSRFSLTVVFRKLCNQSRRNPLLSTLSTWTQTIRRSA
jgi:hypothetical protein